MVNVLVGYVISMRFIVDRPMISELKMLRVNISDFEVKHLIGRGHFGEVNVVKEKFTGDIYAMKTLKKDITLKYRDIAFFEEERDIMALSKSNWLVKLQYSFQVISFYSFDFEVLYKIIII